MLRPVVGGGRPLAHRGGGVDTFNLNTVLQGWIEFYMLTEVGIYAGNDFDFKIRVI